MTKAERTAFHEEVRKYKAEGHSAREVAEKFGIHKSTAKKLCRGMAPKCKNQYTNGKYDRAENLYRIIKSASPDLEYVGGFTTVDGTVTVKCSQCGYEFERSLITFRVKNGDHSCPMCKRERRKSERIAQQEKKRQSKRADRLLKKKARQLEMDICPICGSVYVKKCKHQRYCSAACQHQNRWRMKDGYRYLFPLEEVYERAKGICYICGGLCDWNDKEEVDGVIVYGNLYPSRDHVIPKSKGGENSWENIKLAHRSCNSRKGSTPLVS